MLIEKIRKPDSQSTQFLGVHLPKDVLNRLDAMKNAWGAKRSHVIIAIINTAFDNFVDKTPSDAPNSEVEGQVPVLQHEHETGSSETLAQLLAPHFQTA